MGIRAKSGAKSELVIPKVEVGTTPFSSPPYPDDFTYQAQPQPPLDTSPPKKGSEGWVEFSLGVDLTQVEKVAKNGEKFLSALSTIVSFQQGLIKVLRLFSSDLKSLTRALKALINAVVKNIKNFIDSLISTGVYVAPVIAEFDETLPGFTLPINGGFKEFKSRINALCLDNTDPTAPKFGPMDTVGGMILCCGAGSNDPRLLSDLLENMKILSNFFGFKNPMPSPPRNVSAFSGLFKNSVGKYKPGVKITWDNPKTAVTGFRLYRCKVYEGYKQLIVEEDGVKEINVYSDSDFNGGAPVEFSALGAVVKNKYEYVDLEVEDGVTYHYQVFSTAGFNFIINTYDKARTLKNGLLGKTDSDFFVQSLQRVTSPLGSKRVSATPRSCIPVSELRKNVLLDIDGNPRDLDKLATGGWLNLTVRDLIGNQMDNLLDELDSFAESISGSLTTAGGALDKYLRFIEAKIQRYLGILTKVQNIVQRLMQYRLKGTVLLLNLDAEEGGVEGFVARMRKATVDPRIAANLVGLTREERTGGSKYGSTAPSDIESMEGIFAGVVLLFGYPRYDNENIQSYVPQSEIESYKKQVEKSKKALDTYQKILGLKK